MNRTECSVGNSVVVASANPDLRRRLRKQLGGNSWAVQEALGGAEALSLVEEGRAGTLLLDHWLPDLDVQELVDLVKEKYPEVRVLILGAECEERGLLEKLSGHDVLPLDLAEVHDSGRWPNEADLQDQPPRAPAARWEEPLPGMTGTSAAMQRVFRLARLVIPRSTTVLIQGETGTGKELMARAIHNLSPRAQQPFVIVNCAAIPEALLESELFGHARGAFTGAFQSRLGRIHGAHGGTLFLDEVGELPFNMQGKLLRFLQGGEVQRLGSPDIFQVDVRVIAATNSDLRRAMAQRQFNDALYYRLSIFPIELPPLRERREDILPLATHFLELLSREAACVKCISSEAARILQDYPWPGNVRELEHVMERAFILSEEESVLRRPHFDLSHGTPWRGPVGLKET